MRNARVWFHIGLFVALTIASAGLTYAQVASAPRSLECHHTRCALGNCGFGFERNCVYVHGGLGCNDSKCGVF
jgi:hypothetical protein